MFDNAELISFYSRKPAVADGVLIDIDCAAVLGAPSVVDLHALNEC